MSPDYPLHCRQTDTESSAFFCVGEVLKRGKELVRVSHGESWTVVAGGIDTPLMPLTPDSIDAYSRMPVYFQTRWLGFCNSIVQLGRRQGMGIERVPNQSC